MPRGRRPVVLGCGLMSEEDIASVSSKTRKGYEAKKEILEAFVRDIEGTPSGEPPVFEKKHWFPFCKKYMERSNEARKGSLESY